MLVTGEPCGTMMSTTPLVISTTVRAACRSPMSARTIARSAVPAEKALADSSTLPVSTTLKRISDRLRLRRAAIADIMRAASPSVDPAAIVMILGCV